MNANLFSLFRQCFPADPIHACIETENGQIFSYTDLDRYTARYAHCFKALGLQTGDRVAAQVDKSPYALFVYLACLRAGLIYLPLNTAYREAEIEYFLTDATPKLVLCSDRMATSLRAITDTQGIRYVYTLNADGSGTWPEQADKASTEFDTVTLAPDDPAAIVYTSGTTGHPKGAVLSHENLASNALTLHQAWGWRAGDVLLHTLPLFHVHGLFVACHCALLNASTMLFLPKFDAAKVIALLSRATVFMGVPTFYTRLLANPDFTRETCCNMRLFVSGSAPLLPQTFNDFNERTGHAILERYGMTETNMNASNPFDGPRVPGTVGKPLPGVSIRIADTAGQDVAGGGVGQLLVRGPNVFKGYWRMPERTAEDFTPDGYFRTGDLARIDQNGYITIVGRTKDLIISGGYNVYPKEVESVLDRINGIVESAVIGVPHADFGEVVVAVAVRARGHTDLNETEVIQSLKNAIAGYKVPKRVVFVDELPRNAMGKVQKNILRGWYSGALS